MTLKAIAVPAVIVNTVRVGVKYISVVGMTLTVTLLYAYELPIHLYVVLSTLT